MTDDRENPLLSPEERAAQPQLQAEFDSLKATLREEARAAGNARGKYWAMFGANQSAAYFEGGYHFPRWLTQQDLNDWGSSILGDLKAAYFDGFTEGYAGIADASQKTTDPYA